MFGLKSRPRLKIDIFDNHFSINGVNLKYPLHANEIIAIIGEPDYKEHDLVWYLAWHNLGLSLSYSTWDNIFGIDLQLEKRPKVKHRPKKCFQGDVYVNGERLDLDKRQSMKSEKYQAVFRLRPDEKTPSILGVGRNLSFKETYDPKKYTHKKQRSKTISFSDFNFKLVVVQELMYNQDILTPKFDLYDYVDWFKDRKIDVEEEGYDFIPEVTQWFEALPITEKQAQAVTQLHQDGGDKIYGHVYRFWGGECERFDIESAQDAKHFKNLKSVKLFGLTETVKAEFEAQGIQASEP